MLVLSRKAGERIVIGDNIIVTVTRIRGGRVNIGVEAPREKKVLRYEVTRRNDATNLQTDHDAARPEDSPQVSPRQPGV